ncbi:MAG: deoxyribose-phosphate aldolase [Anaerolineales bacterium]|nr:deoxyribose-phosphate aldolase [Anaerolineales bacterium]
MGAVATIDARHLSKAQLAKMIQFTNVRPYATRDDIVAHLQVCAEYGFDGAMIANCWVPLAREVLRGTGVKVATCIGLGFGQESLHGKLALMRECLALGADEIDYEPNMALYLSGMYDAFREEGRALVEAAAGRPIKAMLEFGYLKTEADKRHAVQLLCEGEVPWIKNSSGWGEGGIAATVEDIQLLREVTTGTKSRVKASGKVNSYEKTVTLINAGAEMLGTSTGKPVMDGYPA